MNFKKVLQGLTFQVLHDNEGMALMLTTLVDGADVGVVLCRCRSGFSLETLQGLAILGKLLRQELDGHFTDQVGIQGTVHLAHAALA